MVYEALTSGAAVGLLAVQGQKAGRVARGMHELQQAGWVTRFCDWDRRSPLPSPPGQLHEARLESFKPQIVFVDAHNGVKEVRSQLPVQTVDGMTLPT